jgi:hypothetical protein
MKQKKYIIHYKNKTRTTEYAFNPNEAAILAAAHAIERGEDPEIDTIENVAMVNNPQSDGVWSATVTVSLSK